MQTTPRLLSTSIDQDQVDVGEEYGLSTDIYIYKGRLCFCFVYVSGQKIDFLWFRM